jgi:YesN/AraC family two-component response regulator
MLSDVERSDMIGQAENFQDAISSIHELNPDVVILDIRMPGGSGIDVLKTIEKRNRMPARIFFDKSREFEKVMEVVNSMSGKGIL